MKKTTLLLLLITCSLLLSCTHKTILKRYSTSKAVSTERSDVRVSSFVTDIDSNSAKAKPILLQLESRGQAQLIKSYEALCKDDPNCVNKNISKKFPRRPLGYDINRAVISAKIVFSIQKIEEKFNPANRISEIELNITHPFDGVNFTKWDKFKTEYAEVDLGNITSKETSSVNAKLAPTLSGTVVGAGEIGGSYQNESTEELSLKKRYVALTGTLSPKKLTINQEGIVGIDLEGNSSINLIINFSDVIEEKVFRINQAKTTDKIIVLEASKVTIPSIGLINSLQNGLVLKIDGTYVLRHVDSGASTIIEGDDNVIFKSGNVTPASDQLIIMSNRDLEQLRARYYLYLFSDQGEQISIDLPRNSNFPLDFATYGEANQFLSWLTTTQSVKVSDKQLKLSNNPLNKNQISELRIGKRR